MEKKISVVMIGVKNMARAVRFYRTVIGLPLKFKTQQYSEFNTQGAILALEKRKGVSIFGPSFTFVSKNAKRDAERLRRRKVRFWKGVHKESYGWVFMPKDSEGNIFEVVQYNQ